MPNGYCVLSVNKIKSYAQINDLDGHIKREFNTENVDISKSFQNKELVSSNGMEMTRLWELKMNEAAMVYEKVPRRRSDSVKVLEIITGMSQGAEKNIDIGKWAEKNKEWMIETFGLDNILSCTLHMDETTPHIHTEVIPLTSDGRLSARDYTGGKWKMMRLQDSYAEAMSEFGLLRGERHTKAKKVKLERFYNMIEQIEDEKLPEIKPGESNEEYLERLEALMKEKDRQICKLQMQLIQSNAVHSARMSQAFEKYTDAVALYDEINDSLGGDKVLVKERICQYRRIELSVPRKTLQTILDGIESRFPANNSLMAHLLDKKKKKRLGLDKMLDDSGFELT